MTEPYYHGSIVSTCSARGVTRDLRHIRDVWNHGSVRSGAAVTGSSSGLTLAPSSQRHLESTRHAILDALAHVLVESTAFGFSVQDVAKRAGVTHRTVYNHFPTREALSEALAVYVEERLSGLGPVLEAKLPPLQSFADEIGHLYRGLATQEVHTRAYVMLMVANRRPARLTRKRSQRFEEAVARDVQLPAGLSAAELSAVLRLFMSSTGWHTLTEHLGLSTERAATAATWATRTLVSALDLRPANALAKSKSKAKAKKAESPKHERRTRQRD
jgi:AcrR family transcriptional regulator